MATADHIDTDEVLGVRGLTVTYGAVTALRDLSIEVRRGEVVALLGANGAGKSTMLRTISGVVRPRAGEVRLEGDRIDGLRPSQIVARGVAHSPEGRRLFGSLTVAENLRLGAAQRRDRENVEADRERLYDLFPILRERSQQQSGTLSGGEQQMVALSRALMARPRLLLLDEPSLGIAPLIVQQIFASLAELKETGVTMLLVEQNINVALGLADRAYVLRTGEISLEGPAADLKRNYEEVAAAYLGVRR
ncbi:ABC transporter ATP-binding protein [Acidimangrovimonas sediminis]|uniref:ABC transporter ATP-binding protein n=1 Tax=Acidimangrovimonas sediminis TaxID=2056283 RepID=UPI001E45D6F5|nr:ABC transporter ATP-binding protein [Acidimangrovimonas sediminis]